MKCIMPIQIILLFEINQNKLKLNKCWNTTNMQIDKAAAEAGSPAHGPAVPAGGSGCSVGMGISPGICEGPRREDLLI